MPRLGQVQDTQDGQNNFAGSGFVVHHDDGRPAASFGFLTKTEAVAAHAKMQDVIALCRHIQGYD